MNILGFDTETTPINYFDSPYLRLWVVNNDDTFQFGTSTKEFIEMLLSLQESTVIVSFNLSFDWYAVFKNIDLTKYFDRIDINVDGTPPFRSVLSYKKTKTQRISIVFLDLVNFVGRHKLEKLAIDWEVQPKLDQGLTWDYCIEEYLQIAPMELLIYCLNDADIVFRIYRDNFFLLMEGALLSQASRRLAFTNSLLYPGGSLLVVQTGLKIGKVVRILGRSCGYALIQGRRRIGHGSMTLTLLILGLCEDLKSPPPSERLSKELRIMRFPIGLKS